MKILFIYPNFNDPFYPNVGMTNLATYINERTTHKARILDLSLYKKQWRNILNRKIKNVDIIGFTSTMGTIISSLEVARYIKKNNPEIPIIFGGIYATCVNKRLLEFNEVDYICIGEGELSLTQMLDQMEQGKPVTSIKGIWCRCNGVILENGISPLIKDLDTLPFNNYDLWDFKKHLKIINEIPMMGSRGCEYNCTFCTQSAMHQLYDKISNHGYHRQRSPKNICDEIEFQIKKYQSIKNIEGIIFYDDTFTSDKHFVDEFCDEFIKRGLNTKVHWAINARMENIDPQMLVKLKRAGCYYLYFGIESVKEETRKLYRKFFTENKITEILKFCKKIGFKIKTYFIIDGPEESVEQNIATLKFARKIRPDSLHIMPFIPLPNTQGAQTYLEKNPNRYKFINSLYDPSNKTIKIDRTDMLVSIVLGHMPESYFELIKYVLSGFFSTDASNRLYSRIIYKTMTEYFFSALKYGRLRFLYDLFIFVKFQAYYNLVTSDLFAYTLKKYFLIDSFKNQIGQK